MMKVGVIGSGSIGPDLAYGFFSALARGAGGSVYLHDIRREALDQGMTRIRGYVDKGRARGKLSPKIAAALDGGLIPTLELDDLADCDYVLEAATEDLAVKQKILSSVEEVVRPDCLIGFATSGIPRARIAEKTRHPERCFVNHPFFPAWRALPIEVVLSGDATFGARMLDTLKALGKVPVVTADVPCFAADDIFCNYSTEAVRIFAEGIATPAQIDRIVNEAIGGGGPLHVLDLTRGNLLNVHCQELMRDAPTGSPWFNPPVLLAEQGNKPWHDPKNPGDPTHDAALAKKVLDRILAVLMARTYFVVDHEICDPRALNWLTRTALGFRKGLLDLAEELGVDHVHRICTDYAAHHPGFTVPPSIAAKKPVAFYRNIHIDRDGDIAIVSIERPEVMNALNDATVEELGAALDKLEMDSEVQGIVLTSFGGALAGADIMELAVLKTPAEAAAKSRRGQVVLDRISAMKKPVVAALNGPVLGGGAELAMACHARVVGPRTTIAQPEVNLGLIPGYGATQRLPRLISVERALELLRTGRSIGPGEACALGWASGEPTEDYVGAAKALIRRHRDGKSRLAPIDPGPLAVPDPLPAVDIGHRSLAIDALLIEVMRKGLKEPLAKGLEIEAEAVGRCSQYVDYDIGMKNFIQNGPGVPANFLHE